MPLGGTACDPYHRNDPRRRAGGVYEELKVLVNREEGCLDAIFDLRLDSREEVNLVSPSVRSQCSLNLRSVRVSDLTTALLSEAAIKHHCGEIAKHGISSHEGDESHHAGESAEHCQSHYRHRLFRKLSVILTKLKPFFLYGKQGWQNYMDEDFKKAICAVPHASQAKSMRFKERSDCEKNGPNGCTEPEYVSWVALSGQYVGFRERGLALFLQLLFCCQIHAGPILVCLMDYVDSDVNFANVEVSNPAFDHLPPDLISLYVTNDGSQLPSYVYRQLSEYYHPHDYVL
eukprot:gene570-614_t